MNFLMEEMHKKMKVTNPISLRDCSPILEKYTGNDWVARVKYSTERYNRVLLGNNELMDVFLICWASGQSSGIHDHPSNGCLMKVLSGSLIENRYDNKLQLTSSRILPVGSVGYMEGSQLHDVISSNGAVSLHIYSPPGYKPTYY
jgi:predicted metal-dependent enzyme (double-stranded beta helix superfamily)